MLVQRQHHWADCTEATIGRLQTLTASPQNLRVARCLSLLCPFPAPRWASWQVATLSMFWKHRVTVRP